MNNRYPKINLKSKNELAKRLAGKNFDFKDAMDLINDVLENYNNYWNDNKKESKPDKEKYVRSAKGTPLGKLLKLINKKILAPHDTILPDFIFGGVSGRDHVKAAYYLLGERKSRTKLGLDISRFFERNSCERIFYLFYGKCGCSKKCSQLLANLCCVPTGPKGSVSNQKTLARGFATSTRLATWSNLDLFLRASWSAKKILKGHNIKIAIFIDDIGITASKVNETTMKRLANIIKDIFENHDTNHSLPLNKDKQNIQRSGSQIVEHLGLRLCRNKITPGKKTKHNQNEIYKQLRAPNLTVTDKKSLIKTKKSYIRYNTYIKSQKS